MAEGEAIESATTTVLTNGHEDSIITKRKHEVEEPIPSILSAPPPTADQQRDLLEILKRHETYGSLLTTAFREQSSGHRSKKTKLSNSHNKTTTISEKLEAARYARWTDIVEDSDTVKEDIIKSVRERSAQAHERPSIAELKEIQLAMASAAWVTDTITSEATGRPRKEAVAVKEESSDTQSNAVQHPDKKEISGTVLTLFGNAPTPKQLFSSLQSSEVAGEPAKAKSELHIEELSLPNGLSATKIEALPSSTTAKGPTFADSFPAPFALPQLTMPKSSKRQTSKGNVVKWESRIVPSKGSKRSGYTSQKLRVADWLSYGGTDARHDSLSPLEKRQQRDRALSSSHEPSESRKTTHELSAELERQEEALFQQAYSSFAPAYDNSRSLVDASVKSMVWWSKVGSRQFDTRFAGQYSLGASVPMHDPALDPALMDETDGDDFAEAVHDYKEPEELEAEAEDELDVSDVEVVMRKITHLLQTLASYQWIRNSIQPSASAAARVPIATPPTVSGTASKPDTPSDEETAVYVRLRDELAQLILRLPPYAVAKVDGEQLAELGISNILTFTTPNYRGQLEEDQVARTARYTAAATAASVASLTRSSTANNPHYSSSSRTPAIGQSANTRYGQSGVYSSGRPSVPASSAQQTSSYNTPTAVPRSQYSQVGRYALPRAPQALSYGQQTQQYRQASTGYGNYGPTYGQGTPPMQNRPATYQAPFQQKSQTAAANAVAYQTGQYGSSPGKSGPVSTTGQQYVQQPQQSGRETPLNHIPSSQTPVSGFQQARAPASLVPRTETTQASAQMQGSPGPAVNGHS